MLSVDDDCSNTRIHPSNRIYFIIQLVEFKCYPFLLFFLSFRDISMWLVNRVTMIGRIDEVSREKKPEIRLRPLATARGTAVAERKLRHVANDLQHGRGTFLLFSDIIVFFHLDLDLGRIYAAKPRVFSEINVVFSASVSFR